MTKDEATFMVDELLRTQTIRADGAIFWDMDKKHALIAALTAQGVPEGWNLVPKVPNDVMEIHAYDVLEAFLSETALDELTRHDALKTIYARMLAAAPPAPVASVADAVAAEREACAKVAESRDLSIMSSTAADMVAREIAAVIRERGQGGAT